MGDWHRFDFSGRRILLVEDHPLNTYVEKKLIEKTGATVYTALNGKEGLDQYMELGTGFFDAILMDVNMPVMDGLTATKEIRTSPLPGSREIPIIAMTTNGYPQDFENSKNAGMNEHLIKPIDPEVLFECLSRYL